MTPEAWLRTRCPELIVYDGVNIDVDASLSVVMGVEAHLEEESVE